MMEPTVHKPVKRDGTELGSLRLDEEGLTFCPKRNSNSDDDTTTSSSIPWSAISKHQANPAKHSKALVKIVTANGDSTTFQMKNRTLLDNLMADITERREHAMHAATITTDVNNNSSSSGDPVEQHLSDVTTLSTYPNVKYQSVVGTITLSQTQLIFQPDDKDNTDGNNSDIIMIDWKDVTNHQSSPAKVAKAMLKLVIRDEKMNGDNKLTFQLADRKILKTIHADVTQRWQYSQTAAATAAAADSSKMDPHNDTTTGTDGTISETAQNGTNTSEPPPPKEDGKNCNNTAGDASITTTTTLEPTVDENNTASDSTACESDLANASESKPNEDIDCNDAADASNATTSEPTGREDAAAVAAAAASESAKDDTGTSEPIPNEDIDCKNAGNASDTTMSELTIDEEIAAEGAATESAQEGTRISEPAPNENTTKPATAAAAASCDDDGDGSSTITFEPTTSEDTAETKTINVIIPVKDNAIVSDEKAEREFVKESTDEQTRSVQSKGSEEETSEQQKQLGKKECLPPPPEDAMQVSAEKLQRDKEVEKLPPLVDTETIAKQQVNAGNDSDEVARESGDAQSALTVLEEHTISTGDNGNQIMRPVHDEDVEGGGAIQANPDEEMSEDAHPALSDLAKYIMSTGGGGAALQSTTANEDITDKEGKSFYNESLVVQSGDGHAHGEGQNDTGSEMNDDEPDDDAKDEYSPFNAPVVGETVEIVSTTSSDDDEFDEPENPPPPKEEVSKIYTGNAIDDPSIEVRGVPVLEELKEVGESPFPEESEMDKSLKAHDLESMAKASPCEQSAVNEKSQDSILSEASDINEDSFDNANAYEEEEWIEGDAGHVTDVNDKLAEDDSSMKMDVLLEAENRDKDNNLSGSSLEDLDIVEEVNPPGCEVNEYGLPPIFTFPKGEVDENGVPTIAPLPEGEYEEEEYEEEEYLEEEVMAVNDHARDVDFVEVEVENDDEKGEEYEEEEYEEEEYGKEAQFGSLLGGNTALDEDDEADEFDVFTGKPIIHSGVDRKASNDNLSAESDGGWSDEDEHKSNHSHHHHRHQRHKYNSDDDNIKFGDDEPMGFFDDDNDNTDEFVSASAATVHESALSGERGRRGRGSGTSSVSTQSSEETLSLSGLTGVVSLASVASDSGSEDNDEGERGEGGSKSEDDASHSDSTATASFEDGSDYSQSDSGSDSDLSSGTTSTSESASYEEEESESSSGGSEEEFLDPASAWLTFSETKSDEVFPEQAPKALRQKLRRAKKGRRRKRKGHENEHNSDEEGEEGDYSWEEGEEGSMGDESFHRQASQDKAFDPNQSLNIEGMSASDLEKALVAKLKSEVGDDSCGRAEHVVNRMLVTIKKDMLGDNGTRTNHSQPKKGIPEDFYDWAKKAATKFITKDKAARFDWKKYAKENAEVTTTEENAGEIFPAAESATDEVTAIDGAKTEGMPVVEPSPEDNRDDAEIATQAVSPDRDSSAQKEDIELQPYDGDLVEQWTLRPRSDDQEIRVFDWEGFTKSRKVGGPTFDWKQHAKKHRKLKKKKAKTAGNRDASTEGDAIESVDEKTTTEPAAHEIVTPVDLLKKLIISSDDATRGAILKQHLAPPPENDPAVSTGTTTAHISPEDLLRAIAKFVETIRIVKKSDDAPEIVAARQVAIVARLVILRHYGDGSDTLKNFERGLAPAFAPPAKLTKEGDEVVVEEEARRTANATTTANDDGAAAAS